MGKRPLITEKHVTEALKAGRTTLAVTPQTLITALARDTARAHGLTFVDPTTLSWSAAPTALGYNAYRDLVSNLAGLGYGSCTQQDLPTPNWTDIDVPPVSDGYFYLITGTNRLGEEGTRGRSSSGAERLGTACP